MPDKKPPALVRSPFTGGFVSPSSLTRAERAEIKRLAAIPPKPAFTRGGIRKVEGDIFHIERPDAKPLRFEVVDQGDHPSARDWKTHHIYHPSLDAVNEFLFTLDPRQMVIISAYGTPSSAATGAVIASGEWSRLQASGEKGHLTLLGQSQVNMALRPSGQTEIKKALTWFAPDGIEHYIIWTRRDGQ